MGKTKALTLQEFAKAYGAASGQPFEIHPHIDAICDALMLLFSGQIKGNLLINIPPRHSKTMTVARLWPAWCMIYAPDSEFITTSYSDPLASASSMAVKDILQSEWYRSNFPWVKVDSSSDRKSTQKEWYTTSGGAMYASPMKGALTGYGAGKSSRPGFGGAIIIDDPLKPEEARSQKLARDRVNDWYTGTLKSRRNNQNVPIVIIMQRVHPSDLCGFVLENEPGQWSSLVIPVRTDDKDGNPQLIWPGRVSNTDLDLLREVDPFTYHSQYRQQPVLPSGNMLKDYWWTYWYQKDLDTCNTLTITADTAFKKTKDADYSCLQLWATGYECMCLIDEWTGQWEWPTLLKNTKAMYNKYRPTRKGELPIAQIVIEDKASGTSLVQQLAAEGLPALPWPVEGDKVQRVRDASWFIQAGVVKLPPEAPWLQDFLRECGEFREDEGHDHDDQVDAMTIAVDIWRKSGGGAGVRIPG